VGQYRYIGGNGDLLAEGEGGGAGNGGGHVGDADEPTPPRSGRSPRAGV
jgi:hypothetical protein